MYTAILILHIIVCFFLVFIVLIQSGKGAELGAAFGGSSQTLFGARGAATIFSKLTTISAVVFMITSLTLSIITARGGSVIKRTPAAVEQKTKLPVAPAGPIQNAPASPNAPAPSAK
ncbi:MAG: preprotein translocase subunit SecG [Nitrospiraceae bacterium]|nr:preprotein translocase subunit SecG [Nitrospiraceae bacterium]